MQRCVIFRCDMLLPVGIQYFSFLLTFMGLPKLNAYVSVFFPTGSFSFSVLSGKVMFRDVYYIDEDMSIR